MGKMSSQNGFIFYLYVIYRRSSIHGTPTHGAGGMMGSASVLQTSHILEQTDSHIIEAYGATLPVVVTEILTLSESKTFMLLG